jgi:hypothetical protein
MNVRTRSRMTNGVASTLATLIVTVMIISACQPAPTTFRPPNRNELLAFAQDQGITPIVDKLLDDSSVLLYERDRSFGCYTLTARESDGAVVVRQSISAAKSDQPILIIGQLTGGEPFIAVVIQDATLLAETTAIEVVIDSQNRLTATTNRQAGAILVSPSPVDGWGAVTLYNAEGQVLYSQEGY